MEKSWAKECYGHLDFGYLKLFRISCFDLPAAWVLVSCTANAVIYLSPRYQDPGQGRRVFEFSYGVIEPTALAYLRGFLHTTGFTGAG